MNPSDTFKLVQEFQRFRGDHPKAVAFAESIFRQGLKEGSVLELKVTDPDGEEKICNLRVTDRDLAMVDLLKELGGKA